MQDGTRRYNPDLEIMTGDSLLGFIYGKSAIHIDNFHRLSGESTLEIRPEYLTPIFTEDSGLPVITNNLYDQHSQIGISTAKLHITPAHTKDHFREGMPQVFPGFKQVATTDWVLSSAIQKNLEEGSYPSLQAMDGIKFLSPILEGDDIEVITTFQREQDNFFARALIVANGAQACVINRLLYQPSPVPDISLKKYAPEIIAQAAGAKILHKQSGKEMLPLFGSIDSIAYGDFSAIQAHDTVTVATDVFGDKSIQGNGIIKHSGNILVEIHGINCALRPLKVVERILNARK